MSVWVDHHALMMTGQKGKYMNLYDVLWLYEGAMNVRIVDAHSRTLLFAGSPDYLENGELTNTELLKLPCYGFAVEDGIVTFLCNRRRQRRYGMRNSAED